MIGMAGTAARAGTFVDLVTVGVLADAIDGAALTDVGVVGDVDVVEGWS